ncbi:MAG: Na/Pi symporter [Phycisphaerales bacterium]|jgi:sodium-dependent phosphate cotransporter|nr:Na/Pi symporter [Phycisphaerales bacterium]MDP6312148.1 Na/Pi symporter [Phycisphaerales bacterium]MDP7087066.1 Na/Pi symporter [Phycisphaerales bacterium]MDP7189626.1 Na/Pi symporter [Phycisphaerales bacterium]MDP7519529.1 Na/Pi symporter [Phycisphaerales bacterium]
MSAEYELNQPRARSFWLHLLLAGFSLYFFLCAINVMGAGLKAIGKETSWLADAIAQGDNPLVALMASVLVTSVVQSSSFTTSLIITLVAAGELSAGTAVFAVMGANIGTSITSLIVSLGTMRIKRQFRRAYATALMHAIPNVLTVLLLFPLEWATSTTSADGFRGGILTRTARWITTMLDLGAGEKFYNPIKAITQPVVTGIKDAANWLSGENATAAGTIVAVVGLVILFLALIGLVKNLKDALLQRLEGLFTVLIFRNDFLAWLSGIGSTVAVQSSSVTTSLMVPIAGAGAVKLRRVFPFMLGCNIGTTVTGVIAATANPTAGAVIVAISHVLFNFTDNAIWYPLRIVPIRLAKWYSSLAARRRRYAFIFLATVFLVVPTVALVISELLFFSD